MVGRIRNTRIDVFNAERKGVLVSVSHFWRGGFRISRVENFMCISCQPKRIRLAKMWSSRNESGKKKIKNRCLFRIQREEGGSRTHRPCQTWLKIMFLFFKRKLQNEKCDYFDLETWWNAYECVPSVRSDKLIMTD